MAKTNLLRETLAAIIAAKKMTSQIVFVGARDGSHACNWQAFQSLANFDYDNTAPAPAVATDLTIVFADGSSLMRAHDGRLESWAFDAAPTRWARTKPITRLHDGAGKSLAELNQ